MRIVVLVGGLSPERDVSISSGTLIANALMECGHEVMVLDLYLGTNKPMFPLEYRDISSGERFGYKVPEREPDLEAVKNSVCNEGRLIGDGVLGLCERADIVFMALHGSVGENGQLQALFDLHNIRYTGTGYIGSLLAMDKDLSKKLLQANGILTPAWKHLNIKDGYNSGDFRFPCVIKPCSCGSSAGVSIIEDEKELDLALRGAKKYEDYIIVEEKITGDEFSVGILGGEALPPIAIKPLSGFYDFKNKYQAGLTEEICPADITTELDKALRENALKVHNILRLGYYSRVDFIVNDRQQIYCLEANTLPGMTPTSLLPQEAKVAGISYNELCERILKNYRQ